MYDNQILKNYMKDKKYEECISFLKKKIISFVIKDIKQINNTIDFTTVSDLITTSDLYLKDSRIARNLESALIQNTELKQIEHLLLICEQNNIK